MSAETQKFKILCPHCEKTFHVRFPLTGSDPDAQDDTGEVTVVCMYCSEDVMIQIPREAIAEDDFLRGE